MKLSRIKIEKLFGQFDYDIKLNQEEDITILTGPNGYGKTTILNIIWGIFNQDFTCIQNTPFVTISFYFKDDQTLRITPKIYNANMVTSDGDMYITQDGAKLTASIQGLYLELINKDVVCETAELGGGKLPENQIQIANFLKSIKVYLIKDQRLTKNIIPTANGLFKNDGEIKRDGKPVEINTVRIYANDLCIKISENKKEEQNFAQSLDASLRKRFKEYETILPENEYQKRFQEVLKKYQALQKYGVYQDDLESTEYEGDERRFFSLNLEDWEKRTAIYDDLMTKIDLFVKLLTGKGFINKTMVINANEGFYFTTLDGKRLEPANLSAGEQNEIILLYELFFKAPRGSLVLIDEPETSMHVAWQIGFLQDIKNNVEIFGLSFIIATHSPDLINDKMDLCVDLFENTRRNGNDGK